MQLHRQAAYNLLPEPTPPLPLRGNQEDDVMLSGQDYMRGLDRFLSRHVSMAGG